MAKKTWTATADFGSADAETTYLDDAIITRHQGNLPGASDGFSAANMPDADGETKSGWTMSLDGGATSAVTFSGGVANYTVKRENSDTKIFKYERPTTQNILKSTTGTLFDFFFSDRSRRQ